MWNLAIGGAIIGVAALWAAAVWRNGRRTARHIGRGDARAGSVLFVEPVRWLFIVWGFNAMFAALRREGLGHSVHLFRWSRSAGSLLVLPDLMRRHRLDVKARRLARRIETLFVSHPGAPLHVVAYSTGVYIAFEAIRQLAPGARLTSVIALHGTVSPHYDVAGVASRAGVVLNVYGRKDWLINGIGPWLFGTNDRVHSPACGMVGLRDVSANVQQRAWQPSDWRQGYWGDHFTVMAVPWLRAHVVPILVASERTGCEFEAFPAG